MSRMPKRRYVMALACYLSIPAVVIAAGGLFRLLDPEMVRGHADYVRDYRLMELAQKGALAAAAGLALILWTATCYLVLKSRQRSLWWLWLAAAGPFGFMFIGMLEDRLPAPDDLYQQFIRKLKLYWRVPLEIAVFVSVWFLAYQSVVLKRELMISFESFSTGTPAATIIAQQNASSGMWAFGEGLEEIYLVTLIYLLWPIFFNLAGQQFKPRTNPIHRDPRDSGN
jgi:UDP-N-acetylmuramyl pentapeptide phosphotransferase/UDP-N-acetylglucosamine-1-phosphate transferase